jgi:hypothetical protein
MCKLPLKIQKLIVPRLVPNDPQSAVPRKKLLKDDVDEENDDVGQHEGDQVVSVQARINVLETIFLKRISNFYFFFSQRYF